MNRGYVLTPLAEADLDGWVSTATPSTSCTREIPSRMHSALNFRAPATRASSISPAVRSAMYFRFMEVTPSVATDRPARTDHPTRIEASGCSWLFRQLRAVPRCDDPHGRTLDSVEEPVGPDDDLAIGQIRKLRDDATGFGKLLQPAKGVVGSLLECRCGLGVLTSDICESRKKLGSVRPA